MNDIKTSDLDSEFKISVSDPFYFTEACVRAFDYVKQWSTVLVDLNTPNNLV